MVIRYVLAYRWPCRYCGYACPLLAHAVIHALQSHTTDTEEKDHGELIWESFNEAALEAQKKVYGNECNMVKECNGGNTQSSGYRQEMADLSGVAFGGVAN